MKKKEVSERKRYKKEKREKGKSLSNWIYLGAIYIINVSFF